MCMCWLVCDICWIKNEILFSKSNLSPSDEPLPSRFRCWFIEVYVLSVRLL
jgi:hypothetical protein